MSIERVKGTLILESRENSAPLEFHGDLFGAIHSVDEIRKAVAEKNELRKDKSFGEVVFNTSMSGYQEILTDPSYYGQIVTMTVAHVGNTGVNLDDPESRKAWCSGFVLNRLCWEGSNWRKKDELDSYLKENAISGICNVDTRALTRYLRSQGVVRGVILPFEERNEAQPLLSTLPQFEGRNLVEEVSVREKFHWKTQPTWSPSLEEIPKPSNRYKVVAYDFGAKSNIFRMLDAVGCDVEVVPANTSAEEVMSSKPDGVFLSNGPGDPSAATDSISAVKKLVGKVPIFGICMGHQILSLALGARTYKLKFGHRGGNQPVLDQTTGRVEISSQNHGYAVDASTLPSAAQVTHINLNDQSVEGIAIPDQKAFSVQYHPEACPGPHDSFNLFDRFIESMQS